MTQDTEALREALKDLARGVFIDAATITHHSWVDGTNGREPDFDEYAGDYAESFADAYVDNITAALATPASDVAPVAWFGPIPHSGRQKPEWLPDEAIVMIAFNPRDCQTAMTWGFAAKRKAPAKDRGWENATAFCVEIPLAQSVDPVADEEALRDALVSAACDGIADDYMTSEKHHPGYVLIPSAKFEAILAALKGPAA